MNRKYYIKNMFWGYFIAAGILYSFWNVEQNYKPTIISLSFLSAFLYPYSKKSIEHFIIEKAKKNSFNIKIFKDGVPRTYMLLIYYILCFSFAIPLVIICLLVRFKGSR